MTMPLLETLPVGSDTAQWSVWGTVARVVVTEPSALRDAAAVVCQHLAAVDAAASRFRPDSEVHAIARAGGRPVPVSPTLAALVRAALDAARDTDGDVDPTLGAALCALGYDRDYATIATTPPGPTRAFGPVTVVPTVDWRDVGLDGRSLRAPAGTLLDLGATAKAYAADASAAAVAERLGTGVLIALGGDIATAGPAPDGGWRILVQDGPAEPACTVTLPAGAALATSSTISRRWRRGRSNVHHILDPRTLRPAPPVWRTASAAAYTCVRANTLATAALVRGPRAPRFLAAAGAPARLVAADGRITTLNDWPKEGPR
jgi:thiamine biosynthesis lipoprotein